MELILFPLAPHIYNTMPHTPIPSQPRPWVLTLVMAVVIVLLMWLA